MKVLNRILAALLAFALILPAHAATLLPNGMQTFLDNNGNPLAGGKVYFYIPSTTTPKSTFKDPGATQFNTNPVILDGSGRALIYGAGAYRQIVQDANGVVIWDRLTADTSSTATSWGGTSTGTPNAQIVPATNFTSSDGQQIGFVAGFTNTGAMTLSPNGASPIAVLKDTVAGSVALTGGEVTAGNVIQVIYSSATGAFHLVSFPPPDNSQPAQTIASASTTDLGTLTSPNVIVSGTTTINSFGSSASTNFPDYFVRFTGTLTLTNSANLILPSNANITTAAGDYLTAQYQGAGAWRVAAYYRQNGKAVIETNQFPPQTGNAGKVLVTDGTNVGWDGKSVTGAVTFAGTTGTAITGSKNIASIVRNSTGNYTITFATALLATYQVLVTVEDGSAFPIYRVSARATTGFNIITALANGTPNDFANVNVVVIGGL